MNFTYTKPSDKDTEQEILPPGWYDFTVTQVYDKKKSGEPLLAKTGKSFLNLVCTEVDSGVQIFHFLFLTSDDAKKISAFIHACGLQVEDGQQLVINAETFMGSAFRGRVDTNTGFDGVFRNRIIRAVPRLDSEPADEISPLDVTARDNDSAASQFVEDQQDNAMDIDDDEVPF